MKSCGLRGYDFNIKSKLKDLKIPIIINLSILHPLEVKYFDFLSILF